MRCNAGGSRDVAVNEVDGHDIFVSVKKCMKKEMLCGLKQMTLKSFEHGVVPQLTSSRQRSKKVQR